MAQGIPRLSRHRKMMINVLILLGTWISIEALSFVAMRMFLESSGQVANQRRAALSEDRSNPELKFNAPAIIHPYIGTVMSPQVDGGGASIDGKYDAKYAVTEYGFVDTGPPIHQRSTTRVIVGILGGAVAQQFGQNATDALAEELSQIPAFAGREFQFVRLANGDYKQPQQLMTVNYLLTLGAEFDILINLDGVNEAALPGIDNVPVGVFSAYPRDWGKMVATTASPDFVRMAGYLAYLRKQERDDALWFGSTPWKYSPTALLVWEIRKQRLDHSIGLQLQVINRYTKKEMTFCGSGPPEHFESQQAMYEHCTELWWRSSLLLHRLCAARGIRYFHFLQPNQYVVGSKPIGQDEAAAAIQEGSPICVAIRACFPLMQAQAPRLAKAGVDITDLTGVFADHAEPIYNDTYCRMGLPGDLIMAKAIAARIRHSLSKPMQSNTPQ